MADYQKVVHNGIPVKAKGTGYMKEVYSQADNRDKLAHKDINSLGSMVDPNVLTPKQIRMIGQQAIQNINHNH